MTATYDCIATTTLSTATASVTFSSISGSYTDLVLVMNILPLNDNDNLGLRFNSDSATNYSLTQVTGNGSSAASNRNTSTNRLQAGAIYNASITTHLFHLMNYSNSTTYKSMLYRYGNASYTTVGGVGLWRSTSAITDIEIVVNGGSNLSASSTFSLFGIKAE